MINNVTMKSTYKRYSMTLLLLLCILTVVTRLFDIFDKVNKFTWMNYVFGLIWVGIIISIKFILPKIHPHIKHYKLDQIYFDAIKYAIIIIVIRYLAGFFIYQIGKSPYDLSPRGFLLNFIVKILPFIGIEMIRGYVLGSFCRKKNIAFFFAVTILIALIDVNYAKISNVKDMESATIFIAENLGPTLCKSLLLSYLALYGGATASICFGGILLVFHWYMPILPELNWLCEGVIGIFVPVFELFLLVNNYENTYVSRHIAKVKRKDTVSWMGTMVLSIALIWFVIGVFPIYPTVIVTGSMKPLISPGDVVLVKQFYTQDDIDALKVGDIIVFQRDDIIITHRIIKILHDEHGNLRFETKGDNNSAEDARIVLPKEVKGKYVLDVPKIGYPTLWLKTRKADHVENVEF